MATGDHLFVSCGAYSHHGIDIGAGRVVHFDSTPWRKLFGIERTDRPAMIKCVSLDEFAGGRDVFVREYFWGAKPEIVVARAWSRIGERGYHLFSNNCEHFAVWCKTGRADSTQIKAFVDAAQPIVAHYPVTMAILRAGKYLPPRARLAAYGAVLSATAGSAAIHYLSNRIQNRLSGES